MSLILKGIDMPKGYVLRIEIEPNGTVWEEGRDWIKHRQSAIQIERPHGRLIDANKVFCYGAIDEKNLAEVSTILEAE